MRWYIQKWGLYPVFRAIGRPRPMPMHLALSVTHRCQANCRTCNVTSDKRSDMDTDAWRRIFDSLGRGPAWFTITGGEPFLRDDIRDILLNMSNRCQPNFVTVATNGVLTDRIASSMRRVARDNPDTTYFLNISLDAIGARHDELRGLPGCFDAALATFFDIKNTRPDNLRVGFHTVISKWNVEEIKDVIAYVRELGADAHGLEPAQGRAELGVAHADAAPGVEEFRAMLPALLNTCDTSNAKPADALRKNFRKRYYRLALDAMENGSQPIPCYSGFAGVHIAPDGDVWACGNECACMGNLPENDFEFARVWRSARAARVRSHISRGHCACALANAMFTSMMFDPASAFQCAAASAPILFHNIIPQKK